MIIINLIPVHMRRRKGSRFMADGLSLPKEVFIGIIGGFVGMLFMVIVVFQALIIIKSIQYKNYEMRMSVLEQDKSNVDRVISELRLQQVKLKSIDEIAGNSRVYLSQKLNDISDNLPRGVWLNRITVEEKFMRIEGSAVSKNRSEMISIHSFNGNLQNSEAMKKYYKSVELELIKSRMISQTPVADFAILAQIKEE